MDIKLKKGTALVLAGPQASGKSILARKIAEQYGKFIETEATELESNRRIQKLLREEARTVIVDGFPSPNKSLTQVRGLIAGEPAFIRDAYQHNFREIIPPNFIFCVFDVDISLAEMFADQRRFWVINLPKRHQ